MVLREEQERLQLLLREAIPMMCKNGVPYQTEFCVEALIGITIDKSDVVLVSIKETFNKDGAVCQTPEKSPKKRRRKRRKSNSSKQSDVSSGDSDNDQSHPQGGSDGDSYPEPAHKTMKPDPNYDDDDYEDNEDELVTIKAEPVNIQGDHSEYEQGDRTFDTFTTTQSPTQNPQTANITRKRHSIWQKPYTGNPKQNERNSQHKDSRAQDYDISGKFHHKFSSSQNSEVVGKFQYKISSAQNGGAKEKVHEAGDSEKIYMFSEENFEKLRAKYVQGSPKMPTLERIVPVMSSKTSTGSRQKDFENSSSHLVVQNKSGKLTCPACDMIFLNSLNLEFHLQKSECKRFKHKILLMGNQSVDEDLPRKSVEDRPYKCPHCSKHFMNKKILESHITYSHGDVKVYWAANDSKSLPIGKLTNISNKVEYMEEPLSTSSIKEDPMNTNQVKYEMLKSILNGSVKSIGQLKKEVGSSNHGSDVRELKTIGLVKEEPRNVKCWICETWFTSLTMLKRHQTDFHNLPKFKNIDHSTKSEAKKCNYCQVWFRSVETLDNHLRECKYKNLTNLSQCATCVTWFISPEALKTHQITKHGAPKTSPTLEINKLNVVGTTRAVKEEPKHTIIKSSMKKEMVNSPVKAETPSPLPSDDTWDSDDLDANKNRRTTNKTRRKKKRRPLTTRARPRTSSGTSVKSEVSTPRISGVKREVSTPTVSDVKSEVLTPTVFSVKSETSILDEEEPLIYKQELVEDFNREEYIRIKQELFDEIESEDGRTFYQCPRCPKKFGTAGAVKKHIALSRDHLGRRFKTPSQEHDCSFCLRTYKHIFHLKRHVRLVHTEHNKDAGDMEYERENMSRDGSYINNDSSPGLNTQEEDINSVTSLTLADDKTDQNYSPSQERRKTKAGKDTKPRRVSEPKPTRVNENKRRRLSDGGVGWKCICLECDKVYAWRASLHLHQKNKGHTGKNVIRPGK